MIFFLNDSSLKLSQSMMMLSLGVVLQNGFLGFIDNELFADIEDLKHIERRIKCFLQTHIIFGSKSDSGKLCKLRKAIFIYQYLINLFNC